VELRTAARRRQLGPHWAEQCFNDMIGDKHHVRSCEARFALSEQAMRGRIVPRRRDSHAILRCPYEFDDGARQSGCVELARDKLAFVALMARHDELIAFDFDEVAHDVDKRRSMDDVVVLERVVKQ
jgi:hypothetical protein